MKWHMPRQAGAVHWQKLLLCRCTLLLQEVANVAQVLPQHRTALAHIALHEVGHSAHAHCSGQKGAMTRAMGQLWVAQNQMFSN